MEGKKEFTSSKLEDFDPEDARVRDLGRPSTVLTRAKNRAGTDAIIANIPGASDLLAKLDEINGQDAYSAEAASVGKLRKEEFLALPKGYDVPLVRPVEVGAADTHMRFSHEYLALVFALNKARAPPNVDADRYGLFRMEAVKCGWVDAQKEIVFVDAPAVEPAINAFVVALKNLGNDLERFRVAVFLIPLIAECVFRSYGHHFISGQSADYSLKYESIAKASLAPEVNGIFRADVLYHNALHWVSPSRVRSVLEANVATHRIPDAVMLRRNSAPAGTALITTTSAVLKALDAGGLLDKDNNYFGRIIIGTEMINESPLKFHKAFYAYGIAGPSAVEIKAIEDAKEDAIKFAPIAQAFLDTLLRDAALGKAKALLKHAELNPVLRKLATQFFKTTKSDGKIALPGLKAPVVDG